MLIKEELSKIVGEHNVLHSKAECYAYALDSTNKQNFNIPDAVIFVENIEQVQKIVKFAYENNIPLIARGAGTNLCGGCLCNKGGIVLNFSKMNKILEINSTNMTATVQMGVIVGDLKNEVEKLNLFYPPDPSNLCVSTIGGSIAMSSGGAKTFKYGSTKDYVLNLKVVLQDGSLIETGSNTIKNVTGYNLTQLFVGSEGTLGIIVEATLKLIPKPEKSELILVYFDSIHDACNMVNILFQNRLMPASLDFLDRKTLQTIEHFYPSGFLDKEAALFIEIDGLAINLQRKKIISLCEKNNGKNIKYTRTKKQLDKLWISRRSSFAACAKLKPNVVAEDVAVPRNKIEELILGIREICNKNNLLVCMMGHIGDGNIHPNIPLDLNNKDDLKNYQKTKDEIHKLAIKLGGTLSGEHGIGLEKAKYMKFAINNTTLHYMKLIKKIFDEKNIFNPGKIFE
jgi:glycolate oxidase